MHQRLRNLNELCGVNCVLYDYKYYFFIIYIFDWGGLRGGLKLSFDEEIMPVIAQDNTYLNLRHLIIHGSLLY